ncbi:hypothetical protein MHPYR_500050 [uncultured Mycobacterium sp.]|uniref:Uncharacterized protein n=1 Tax=uncultured Mycobacterium sp. TaxID=171292 RepID=A0A1Y5PHH0_9MYCO|nr:hypothetical protein MHPYR_500050 [uncultured Mycobacterium sp.]
MMSDDADVLAVRQGPRTRAGNPQIADFTLLVRVPGRPAAARVFTDGEASAAAQYATETGGVVEPLPLPPPTTPPRSGAPTFSQATDVDE